MTVASREERTGVFWHMFCTLMNHDNRLSKHSQDTFLRALSRSLRPIQDIDRTNGYRSLVIMGRDSTPGPTYTGHAV